MSGHRTLRKLEALYQQDPKGIMMSPDCYWNYLTLPSIAPPRSLCQLTGLSLTVPLDNIHTFFDLGPSHYDLRTSRIVLPNHGKCDVGIVHALLKTIAKCSEMTLK
jgi:hypothetical protein